MLAGTESVPLKGWPGGVDSELVELPKQPKQYASSYEMDDACCVPGADDDGRRQARDKGRNSRVGASDAALRTGPIAAE